MKVDEDMQGFSYLNSVVEADGNQDVVFSFKNGTGANRIASIDGIFLDVKGVDVGENKEDSFYMPSGWLEYDLDKGTVTIPARRIYDERLDFAPYVYKVKMQFTLADGETVYEFEDDFISAPADEFQNPGNDAWYFIYREPEPGELMKGDITGDGIVDGGDLLYMLRVVSKRVDLSDLSTAQIDAGDVVINPGDSQGLIDGSDLLQLLRYVSKRIDSLE